MIGPDDSMTREWPPVIMQQKPVFAAYSKAAHSVGMLVLNVLARKLGVDPEELNSRHSIEGASQDHVSKFID